MAGRELCIVLAAGGLKEKKPLRSSGMDINLYNLWKKPWNMVPQASFYLRHEKST